MVLSVRCKDSKSVLKQLCMPGRTHSSSPAREFVDWPSCRPRGHEHAGNVRAPAAPWQTPAARSSSLRYSTEVIILTGRRSRCMP